VIAYIDIAEPVRRDRLIPECWCAGRWMYSAHALQWLEVAIKAGYPVQRLERSPWLQDLRCDERYTRLGR
jgi:hypothetical protein